MTDTKADIPVSSEEATTSKNNGENNGGGAETKDDTTTDGGEGKEVTEPHETDVLCGRGGAALRHPGNQTYRRLVNLNKGLYITCLKTEKLKISRSIVAAIREQNGRFLERDTGKGTWFDIGDKKAIEKTSQALREGQPKLRQKIVEMGGAPPGSGLSMEHHAASHVAATAHHHHMGGNTGGAPSIPGAHFANGIYNPNGLIQQPGGGGGGGGATSSGFDAYSMSMQQQQQQEQQQQRMQQQQQQQQPVGGDNMPPPPSRAEFSPDMLMRLSLHTNSDDGSNPSSSVHNKNQQPNNNRLRTSFGTQGSSMARELGIGLESNKSLMSDFSGYSGTGINESFMSMGDGGMMRNSAFGDGGMMMFTSSQTNMMMNNGGMGGGAAPGAASAAGAAAGSMGGVQPPPPPPSMAEASPGVRSFDRRRLFAKMKYSRPASGRFNQHSQRSMGTDGMPDIHMVDSNYSLLSGHSNHGAAAGAAGALSGHSNHGAAAMDASSDHPIGVGSRRSLMSGLSKISDHSSDVNSIFSDLSRKIGNVSTRSIAMSEISGIEEGFHESFEESFNIDPGIGGGMDFDAIR